MTTETLTDPATEAPPVWPPVSHIKRGRDKVKPGDLALCGAKLMGIDLTGMHVDKKCEKCEAIYRRERGL